MFVFACPIIAKSQCWLFALRANIRICPHMSVFVLVFNFQYLRSGLKDVKVQGKICIRSYFNKINTLQHIGIKFNLKRNN